MSLQSEGRGKPVATASGPAGRRRSPGAAVPLRARLWLAGGGLAAAALIAVLLASQSHATGAARAGGRITTASVATFRHALIERLDAQRATYHWVVCVPSGRRFEGVRIVRCNVDFGDPHIQAYCSVLRGGTLLTSQEDPAIPCGHDNAGYSISMQTFG